MDLAKLRAYVGSERTLAVLVITDGAETIYIRTDGDPAWLQEGVNRLLGGALDLQAVLEPARVAVR
jgi:hypothetical protein